MRCRQGAGSTHGASYDKIEDACQQRKGWENQDQGVRNEIAADGGDAVPAGGCHDRSVVQSPGLAGAQHPRRHVRNPTRLYVQLIVSLPALALLVPSAITRNAIMIPAYREALDRMGVDKNGAVGRAIMLALGMLNPLASSALLTGGVASIAAATLLGGFSWLRRSP